MKKYDEVPLEHLTDEQLDEFLEYIENPFDETSIKRVQERIKGQAKSKQAGKMLMRSFLAVAAAILFLFAVGLSNQTVANALAQLPIVRTILGGARLQNDGRSEVEQLVSKNTAQENAKQIQVPFEEIAEIKPITVAEEPITKELLMKYKWVVVPNNQEGTTIGLNNGIIVFNDTEENSFRFDFETKTFQPQRDFLITYALEGNQFTRTIERSGGTLHSQSEIIWADGKLLFYPSDDFDHKEERKYILMPVEVSNFPDETFRLATRENPDTTGSDGRVYGFLDTSNLTTSEGVDFWNEDKSIRYSLEDGKIMSVELNFDHLLSWEEVAQAIHSYMEDDAVLLEDTAVKARNSEYYLDVNNKEEVLSGTYYSASLQRKYSFTIGISPDGKKQTAMVHRMSWWEN